MVIITLQQIINERISFLKEQINQDNKPEVNSTFQLQIDAIRSVDDHDIEKVEFIIKEKKALLKNSKDVHESDRLFAELDGLEWLQRQIERYLSASMRHDNNRARLQCTRCNDFGHSMLECPWYNLNLLMGYCSVNIIFYFSL
jgi:hypothetical protein